MSEAKKCGQCQREIPSHAPFGICPVCVLNLATENSEPQVTDSRPQAVSESVPEPHELAGKFPNLEIVSLLGRGGMGAVYLARQTSLDRIVALKVLSSGLADDPSFTERFAREAKTLAKLTHPNIVTVFDSGQCGDGSYLVMEYVEGVNLRDAILSKTIDPARALAIVQQICDALQHAHDAGVIHRDIKPENILIDRNGLVKIADFGLAKLLQPKAEQYSLTGTRQVLGTRNYMAPEQIESPESVDHRADLYSLGVVLYELLTGELPIGRFAPPSSKSGCSQQLDSLVMRTLEKDPGQRFQQASMIGSAVRELESSIGLATGSTSLVEAITRTENVSAFASNRNEPLIEPIPFSISNIKSTSSLAKKGKVSMHIAKAQGLLHAFEDRIELEYRVHDPIEKDAANLQVAAIRLDDLSSVKFEPAWWGGAGLRFQAMSLSSVEKIPKARQGAFCVNVKQRDRASAHEFADIANRKIVSRNPKRSSANRNRDFEPVVTLEDMVLLDERLKVPCLGFWIAGIATFLSGILLIAASITSVFHPDIRPILDKNPIVPIEFIEWLGPMFFLTSIIPVIAAYSLKRHRNYHLSVVMLLAMLAPWISPLFIMQIPLAIWALVVLCMPTTRRVFRDASMRARLAVNKKQSVFKQIPWPVYLIVTVFPILIGIAGYSLFMPYQISRQQLATPIFSETRAPVGPLTEISPSKLSPPQATFSREASLPAVDDSANGFGTLREPATLTTRPPRNSLSKVAILAIAFLGVFFLVPVLAIAILGVVFWKRSKSRSKTQQAV